MICTYIFIVFFYHVQSPPIIYTDTTPSNGEHISGCSYHFLYLCATWLHKKHMFGTISLLKCRHHNGAWPNGAHWGTTDLQRKVQNVETLRSQKFLSNNILFTSPAFYITPWGVVWMICLLNFEVRLGFLRRVHRFMHMIGIFRGQNPFKCHSSSWKMAEIPS